MLYLRTTINGEYRYIDLFEDEVISLDYSYAEIQDITNKNSTYTKTFSIPGSKENNDIFQHYYDVNSSMTDYDIRNIFESEFMEDGYTLIKGYIRLENVSILNKNVTYNVTFYSNVGLLTSNMGDKVLRDLDYTELNHPYTLDVITRSLYDPDFSGGTEAYEDGRLTYMLAQYGYEYDDNKDIITNSTPIIDYRSGIQPGYFDYIGTPLRFYYLKPSIQLKWIYYKIFEEAGFRIKSDFFETAYFKRFYLPLTFNIDQLYLNQTIRPEFHFRQDARNTFNFSSQTINWLTLPSPPGTFVSMERVLQLPVISNNIDAHQFSDYSFVVPQQGNYEMKMTIEAFNLEQNLDIQINQDSIVEVFFHQIEQGGPNGTTGTTLYFYSEVINVTQYLIKTTTFNVFLDPSYSYAIDVNLNGSAFPAELTYAELQIINGPRTIIGDVQLERELPENEQKQIDFITTINRRFNLVVTPDTDDEDTFIIEPVIDYLNKGDVLDLSERLDYDSNISILPTTSVVNGTLFYNTQEDEDYGNTEFTKSRNITYGTRFVQLDLDYKSETTEFNGIVSHSVDDTLKNINAPNITIPIYYITREENNEGQVELFYNARKTKPRIVFRGINLPANNVGKWALPFSGFAGNNSFYIENRRIDMFPQYNRFGTYPYGLTGFTHAVNFNKTHRFNPLEYDFSCYKDLYDVYYEDYIQDLTDADSRVLIASFYLHPEEIAQLKGNERIFVQGNYYRINKINGYDLTKRGLTEVELIKITGDYEPHPVRYYKLQNCSDSSDFRYSNTDLNYTLWAYRNKRVKLDNICYTILDDVYRDNVTYEKIEVPFQNNSFLPQFYDNCGCTTQTTELIVYRELDCVVPQPQPTPTGITQYYYYILEDCTGGRQILARSTTYYNYGQVVRTSGGGNTCYFVFDFTTTQNTNDIINTYDNCEECAADIPTPTPTRTPQPTPTPSSTPCNCREYEIENFNPYSERVFYDDCFGVERTPLIGPYSFIVDCLCEGSLITPAGVSGRDLGTCIETTPAVTPTPTRTPTQTRTPSPTPSNCACYNYQITNNSEDLLLTYDALLCGGCVGSPTTYSIIPGQTITICACNNSVTTMDRDVVITKLSCCSIPTPTPTRTPTRTPTPSPLVPSLTYITSLSNNTSSTSYSFSATSIGGPGLIVVAFQTERTTTLIQTPTITIGGVSATIAGDSYSGTGSPNTSTLIAYARITTGTTANISITYPASQTRIGIGVWRIQNNISDTPIQVQKSAANSGTGLSITLTGLTSNNLGICAQTNGVQGTTMTWTNATENYDYDIGSPAGTRISGASFITSSSGNRTITTSHTNSGQAITLLGVVWN